MNYKLLEVDYDLSWSSSYKKHHVFVGENKAYKLKVNITNEGQSVDFKNKHLSVKYKLPEVEDIVELVHFIPEYDTVTVDLIDGFNANKGVVVIEISIVDFDNDYLYTCPIPIKIPIID